MLGEGGGGHVPLLQRARPGGTIFRACVHTLLVHFPSAWGAVERNSTGVSLAFKMPSLTSQGGQFKERATHR